MASRTFRVLRVCSYGGDVPTAAGGRASYAYSLK